MRSRLALLSAGLAMVAFASSCSALRDAEPFTATIVYDLDQNDNLIVTPSEITVDGRYGLIQVVNNTSVKRNFDIDELAVYEGIPGNKTRVVSIEEARDNRSYVFYDHKHATGDEQIYGKMIVRYKAKQER